MINLSITRGKYILKPTVPADTETVDYTVSVGGEYFDFNVDKTTIQPSVVFVGKTRYFGGNYEVDCSDWIDGFITKYMGDGTNSVTKCTVSIDFTYTDVNNLSSGQTMSLTWTPDIINLEHPSWDNSCGGGLLMLYNSGFELIDGAAGPVIIKLNSIAGRLIGTATNKIEKTNYMDKYGDTHNAFATNRYEIECYVDPDWFQVGEYSGGIYNQLMTAMQTSRKTYLKNSLGSVLRINGIPGSGGNVNLEGRVKDVDKVDVYSIYSPDRKVPTMKITFEVYR